MLLKKKSAFLINCIINLSIRRLHLDIGQIPCTIFGSTIFDQQHQLYQFILLLAELFLLFLFRDGFERHISALFMFYFFFIYFQQFFLCISWSVDAIPVAVSVTASPKVFYQYQKKNKNNNNKNYLNEVLCSAPYKGAKWLLCVSYNFSYKTVTEHLKTG